METRKLGNSDMHITRLGLGAWAMGGGDWAYAWGAQDNNESIATIHHALDLGINWIDTAAVYGLGHSEQIVGEAINGMHEKPYIFTKCAMIWDEDRKISYSLKANSVRSELEASLRRLNVEVIDLYQIHWPNPDSEIEEGWDTLAQLQKEGKVRYIGVSNFSVSQMQRCQQIAPITSLQPPYSMISPDVEAEILPFCEANTIGVIVYSPMQSGLLTGKMTRERVQNFPEDDWRKRNKEYIEPNLTRNLAIADALGEIGEKHGHTIPEVAIAWTLRLPSVTGAIVGARRPEQVDDFIHASEFALDEDDIAKIASFGV